MAKIKFEFDNTEGQTLAGLLESPESSDGFAHCAIFAHCFTCGKDIAAASRIARALANSGIAVLRFDFTGLGNSDGDFANTNFSSNVQDIVAAAHALEERYTAPSLLIGHSLGGAAVLSAAEHIPSLKGVVTIAAPATAQHVKHLFCEVEPELAKEGHAKVEIGPRKFDVKQQLIDDLNQHADMKHIGKLNMPLLVFHSPLDTIVDVSEAGHIYNAAKHPKSFISLDKADHLLSNKDDSHYVATTMAAWASRYLTSQTVSAEHRLRVEEGSVKITELDKKFLRGMYTYSHQFQADEPVSFGGTNLGPNPYDLLLMSLGSCTSMTIRMYANHKKWPLDDVIIDLKHEKTHAEDCTDCEKSGKKVDRITRHIEFVGELSDEQRGRLLEIADRCPVHRTLENNPVVETIMA